MNKSTIEKRIKSEKIPMSICRRCGGKNGTIRFRLMYCSTL